MEGYSINEYYLLELPRYSIRSFQDFNPALRLKEEVIAANYNAGSGSSSEGGGTSLFSSSAIVDRRHHRAAVTFTASGSGWWWGQVA